MADTFRARLNEGQHASRSAPHATDGPKACLLAGWEMTSGQVRRTWSGAVSGARPVEEAIATKRIRALSAVLALGTGREGDENRGAARGKFLSDTWRTFLSPMLSRLFPNHHHLMRPL